MKKIKLLIIFSMFGFFLLSKPVFADTIYACKLNDPGFPGGLYFVGTTVPTCNAGDEVISWNQMGPAQKQFVFRGITTTKADGDKGAGRFSQLCAEEVSPDSRFCNTKEVLQSINPFPITIPVGEAIWVHPVLMPTGVVPFLDYSGYELGGTMSCSGWDTASQNQRGLSLRDQGSVTSMPCNLTQSIACCGPAQ